jgi:hypothetical protein
MFPLSLKGLLDEMESILLQERGLGGELLKFPLT